MSVSLAAWIWACVRATFQIRASSSTPWKKPAGAPVEVMAVPSAACWMLSERGGWLTRACRRGCRRGRASRSCRRRSRRRGARRCWSDGVTPRPDGYRGPVPPRLPRSRRRACRSSRRCRGSSSCRRSCLRPRPDPSSTAGSRSHAAGAGACADACPVRLNHSSRVNSRRRDPVPPRSVTYWLEPLRARP